ncbi:TonB-linked SusC/RagA family outer membrane protein [Salinibacter ruber]|uniref:SusC/RagA family TonB-linked outer membrane protein n=1 Tax=Salinibacter ruber TaxID=146919 RepID=UPI0021687959|nr:SusC/RagA family TonB-linked outer membrane protein [Salinibacter ruber]MCS3675430.1 TonB-linked SusC/RagA family outer membrane protein [Salinibacter ruber]
MKTKTILSLAFPLAFLLVLSLPAHHAHAQEGTVAGTVVDRTTGSPVPGVNVVLSELNSGAATDESGAFRIEGVPVGSYQLQASFVGYETKSIEVEVEEGETTSLTVELVPQDIQLEDVVVTALGVEREERALGYSVGQIDGANLQQGTETNFVSGLTGKVAGLRISNSSQMGGSSNIQLRGISSIAGDNQPLIVIDGVPINNSSFNSGGQSSGSGGYDYGNAASMINPSEVQSISVLKGASAAALYGSRAANGVIEVATKDGSQTEGIGVDLTQTVTGGQVYGYPDYQNMYGGGSSAIFSIINGERRADYGTDQSWGPRLDGRQVREWFSFDDVNGLEGQRTPWDANPDNVRNFFRNSFTSTTNLAFSQGGEGYSYRLSLNNVEQRGTAPESRMARRNFSFNGQLDLTEKLSAQASANFSTENANGRPGSGYTNANGPWLQFNHFGQRQIDLSDDAPMQDIARPGGAQRSWNWANSSTAPESGDIIYANNPYWLRERNFQEDDTQRLFGKVRLAYDLTESLTVSANARNDYYNERRQNRIAIGSVEQPQYAEDVYEVQETNAAVEVEYEGQVTETISLRAFAGGSYRYESQNENLGSTSGGLATEGVFTLENSVSRPSITDYFQEQAVAGLFGDVNVGYNNIFYVGGSLRNDWASTLPDGNNSYLYPSVNTSFVFSNLAALEDVGVLSFGKVRASWSQVGRDTEPYQLSFNFPLNTPYGSQQLQSLPTSLPNSNLKRELKTSWEVGTQIDLFQNRVGIDATYYSNETSDLIQEVSTSRASGFGSRVLNAGTITNRGVELNLDITPVVTESFNWDLRFNWSKNVNEVESLAEGIQNLPVNLGDNTPPFGPEVVAREGEPFGTFYGNGFVRDDNGNLVLSSAGTYRQEGPKVLGSYLPDWTGSVSTTLSYNNLTLSVLVDGQKGGDIWSLSNLFGLYSGMFEETVRGDIRERGIVPQGVLGNGDAFTRAVAPRTVFQTLFGNHEANIYDASFIKLRETTLSYRFPQRLFTNLPVQDFRISLIGRNLATLFKNTPNFDPTAVTRDSGNLQGIEAGQLPPRRTFGFRLNASF